MTARERREAAALVDDLAAVLRGSFTGGRRRQWVGRGAAQARSEYTRLRRLAAWLRKEAR